MDGSCCWEGGEKESTSSSSASVELVSPFRPHTSIHSVIFVLVFLDHVFLSVDTIKHVWELFLMTSSAGVPAAFSFCRIFVRTISSFPVVAIFRRS
jgi:hypothetical protein